MASEILLKWAEAFIQNRPHDYEAAFRKTVTRGVLIINKFRSSQKYPDDFAALICIVPKKQLEKIKIAMREVPTLVSRMPVHYKYLRWYECRFKKFKIFDNRKF
jgi:hypothetical protein